MVANGPSVCDSNAELLRQHGYAIDIASDGEAGWQKLLTNSYHLLITENNLPGLTGVGLVKKLRHACMPLPVIMVIEVLPSWQSADYPWLLTAIKLLKPFTIQDLLDVASNACPTVDCSRAAMAPPTTRKDHRMFVSARSC